MNWQTALAEKKARQETFCDTNYVRLLDDTEFAKRGSVWIDEKVIHAYPSIGRLLSLQNGIAQNFIADFYAEEKIDGYNVRLIKHQDGLLAWTRGGLLCPFSTDRAADWIDLDVFNAYPDLVICAEIAGPDNPYLESSPPFITEDVQLYVFDLMWINQQGFLPQAQAYDIIDRYRLPTPQRMGKFTLDKLEALREILIRFHHEMREGVVFKEISQRQKRVKYATANSCILDIAATAHLLQDTPPNYYLERIWRSALFLQDMHLARTAEFNQRLGQAFIEGIHKAIAQFQQTGKLRHRYRCRFHDRAYAEHMVAQLESGARRQHVHVRAQELIEENNFWVLEFYREYPVTAGLLNHWLTGVSFFD